jgi:O-glycosyl hydrolase
MELSPYIFNKEFYINNLSILNIAIDANIANYRAVYNHYIKRLREAYKKIINSTILEAFRPIKLPDLPRLIRAHLPDLYIVKDPISFFEIFLHNEDYNLIITNTNKYTIEYLTLYPGNSHQVFKSINQQEIKVLITI